MDFFFDTCTDKIPVVHFVKYGITIGLWNSQYRSDNLKLLI